MEKDKLLNEQMSEITGGAITSPLINAVTKAVSALYYLGEKTGSAVRRLISGNYCAIR